MDDGVPKGHGEASGCHCSGVFGCGLVRLLEAGAGARAGCCHCEGI